MPQLTWDYMPHKPSWGIQTSRANFCEEDYHTTGYVAEFVNTVSNLAYIILAYHGYRHHPGDSVSWLPYLALGFVGLASGIFHATLKQFSQFTDDFSMLLGSAVVLHRVLTIDRGAAFTRQLAATLVLVVTGAFLLHIQLDDQVTHELAFSIMILGVCVECVRRSRAKTRPEVQRSRDQRLAIVGAVTFVSGYGLWQIDHIFCAQLNRFRHYVGMPLGFLTEMHAWWHVLTAVGVFSYIVLVERLRAEAAGGTVDVGGGTRRKE